MPKLNMGPIGILALRVRLCHRKGQETGFTETCGTCGGPYLPLSRPNLVQSSSTRV